MPSEASLKNGAMTPPTPLKKSLTAFILVVPFVAVAAIPFVWPWVAVPSAMTLAAILYFATGQAISVSFHRELTHGAIRLRPVARRVQAFLALLAVEGTIKDWCAFHRMHHEKTDVEGDPHSPHLDGPVKGFVYAHCGWFFKKGRPDYRRYIPDLLRDKWLMRLDSLFPWIAVSSFVLPGFIILAFEPNWRGFLAGVFWGGFVRIFVVHHITWSINSGCHLWGTRPFRSDDQSTNNFLFGLFGFGEGWHRNHHAFKNSARIGLRWWEFDPSWLVIKMLCFFGQVEMLKVPTLEQIKAKKAY